MKTNEMYTDISTNMKLKNTKFLKHKSRGGILNIEIYICIQCFIEKESNNSKKLHRLEVCFSWADSLGILNSCSIIHKDLLFFNFFF